ncbi:MAG TPA: hypothetical protein VLA74_02405 [Nitrososphaeraceae archaeon]|nr:hypothetical protein [Nitrososphaeraceae archaeon]
MLVNKPFSTAELTHTSTFAIVSCNFVRSFKYSALCSSSVRGVSPSFLVGVVVVVGVSPSFFVTI